MKEAIIQKSIMDYLQNFVDCYFFRSSAGMVKTQDGRYFKSGKPGVPDITVCLKKGDKGLYVGFEVKNERGMQSASQKKAEEDIKAAGGHYYIVRSINDVKKAIDEILSS